MNARFDLSVRDVSAPALVRLQSAYLMKRQCYLCQVTSDS